MRKFLVLLLAAGGLGLPAGRAPGCWKGIDPQAFAWRCPVIVTGTITHIDTGCPADDPTHDTAHITVSAVHKALLKDLPVRARGEVWVRMSARHAKVRRSTDLWYPVGTTALWLLELREDGFPHVDTHPVQRQPVGKEREVTRGELVRVSGPGGGGTGTHTRAEWIARMRRDTEGGKDKQLSD